MRTWPGSSPSGDERSVWASLGGVGGEEEGEEEEEEEVDEAGEKEDEEENIGARVPKRQLVALVTVIRASSRQEGGLLVPAAPCRRQRSISGAGEEGDLLEQRVVVPLDRKNEKVRGGRDTSPSTFVSRMLRASAAAANAAASAVAPPTLPRRRRQPLLPPLAGKRAIRAAAARGAVVLCAAVVEPSTPSNQCLSSPSSFRRIGPLPCSSPFQSRRGGSYCNAPNARKRKGRYEGSPDEEELEEDEEASTTTTTATLPSLAKPCLVDLLPPEPPPPPRAITLLARFAPYLASQELLKRIGVTVLAIAVMRIGGCVPVPEARQALDAAARVAAEAAASAASAAVSSAAASASSSSSSAAAAAASAAASAAAAAAASFPEALADVFGHGGAGGGGGKSAAAAALGVLALGIGPCVTASIFFAVFSLKFPGFHVPLVRDFVVQAKREGREGVAAIGLASNLLGSAFALVVGMQASARTLGWARQLGVGAAAESAASAVSAALKGRSAGAAGRSGRERPVGGHRPGTPPRPNTTQGAPLGLGLGLG